MMTDDDGARLPLRFWCFPLQSASQQRKKSKRKGRNGKGKRLRLRVQPITLVLAQNGALSATSNTVRYCTVTMVSNNNCQSGL